MSHHLDACWVKLERAKEHLETLESEVIASASGNAPEDSIVLSVDREVHPSGHFIDYRLKVEHLPDQPFLRWGVVIGDFLHNLRSALDHLAWQLVDATYGIASVPRKDRGAIAFPISDGPRSAFLGWCKRALPGVPYPLLALVESEQPYATYHFIELSPLRRIRLWSNRDKHRLITPVGIGIQDTPKDFFVFHECVPMIAGLRTFVPLEPGAVVGGAFVTVQGPNAHVEMKGPLSTYIAFEGGEMASVYLPAMVGAVERILESFQPFFDGLP